MRAFNWSELERLNACLSELQSRLKTAQATNNFGTARLVDQEIAQTEAQRKQVLNRLLDNFVAHCAA